LLLAKLIKAKERKIELLLPNDEHWQQMPDKLTQDQLCSVEMWQSSFEYGLSVTNNGTEITQPLDDLTTLGYTTKSDSKEHGIGLYFVFSQE